MDTQKKRLLWLAYAAVAGIGICTYLAARFDQMPRSPNGPGPWFWVTCVFVGIWLVARFLYYTHKPPDDSDSGSAA